jgi:hypothetical protein
VLYSWLAVGAEHRQWRKSRNVRAERYKGDGEGVGSTSGEVYSASQEPY